MFLFDSYGRCSYKFIPKLIELGLTLLLSLLQGIADNIQEITATVLEIVEEFLRGLASEFQEL